MTQSAGPLERLIEHDGALTDQLRAELLELGQELVPLLLGLLERQELVPGDQDLCVNVVDLLVDLRAASAAGPLLELLVRADWLSLLHARLVKRLPELGAAVVDPALALLARPRSKDQREALCTVLACCGTRDERIFAVLVALLEEGSLLAPLCLQDYGDARALALLEQALWRFTVTGAEWEQVVDLESLLTAYGGLGGQMAPELEEHLFAVCDQFRESERMYRMRRLLMH